MLFIMNPLNHELFLCNMLRQPVQEVLIERDQQRSKLKNGNSVNLTWHYMNGSHMHNHT